MSLINDLSSVPRVAGIDCGTNSIRLMIAEVRQAQLYPVLKESRIVRLGQGVDATGRLDEQALARTFEALDEYVVLMKEHGVQYSRFVATSATRDASNRDLFVRGVAERLGYEPEVITGAEEARLSFLGALSGLPQEQSSSKGLHDAGEPRSLVIDLGGGSTEFVIGWVDEGGQPRIDSSYSCDMGSVRLSERFVTSDPVSEQERAEISREVRSRMEPMLAHVDVAGAERVIGVAGTVTTVVASALGLGAYEAEKIHGAGIPLDLMREASLRFADSTREERLAMPYLHPGRVDVIAAGALILNAVLERLSEVAPALKIFTASETDILDGITLSVARGE